MALIFCEIKSLAEAEIAFIELLANNTNSLCLMDVNADISERGDRAIACAESFADIFQLYHGLHKVFSCPGQQKSRPG